jgi:hypothetical protein
MRMLLYFLSEPSRLPRASLDSRGLDATAATAAAKSAFEISRARQSPNAADMVNMALGNELNTKAAHTKSFRPDVST